MTRVPVVAGDNNAWGPILVDFLGVGHDATGETRIDGVFNVKDSAYGATGDGTTDDYAAIAAAITACSAAGGGIVFVPSGTYAISSLLTVPASVSIQGCGSAQNTGDAASRFKCTASGSGLTFTGDGGFHQGFYVDGNSVATNPFSRMGSVAGATFQHIDVRYGASDGVLISEAQNDTWIAVQSQSNGRHGFQIDRSAGGHLFLRCESNANVGSAVYVQQSVAASGGAYSQPTHITFEHCIMERGTGAYSAIKFDAGERITLRDCVIGANSAGTYAIEVADSSPCGEITVSGGSTYIFGGSSQVGIHAGVSTGAFILEGRVRFNVLQYAVDARTGSNLAVGSGSPGLFGGCTFLTPTSNRGSVSTGWINQHVLYDYSATADQPIISTQIVGESYPRLRIRADGVIESGGGSGSVDVNLYRYAANQWFTSDMMIAFDGFATKTKAGTPSDINFSSTPPDGTLVVDTTGNKLWVKCGGTWKFANLT